MPISKRTKNGMLSSACALVLIAVIVVSVYLLYLKPRADNTIEFEYRGVSGTEQMVVSVNGKDVYTDDSCGTSVKKASVVVASEDRPVKSIVVNFKNDTDARDIIFGTFKFGGKNILNAFSAPSGLNLSAESTSSMHSGQFKWGGAYQWTP